MKANMGTIDKVIRLFIAGTIAALYLSHVITGLFGNVLLVVAAVFVLTGLIGFCPLYRLVGISTCRIKS